METFELVLCLLCLVLALVVVSLRLQLRAKSAQIAGAERSQHIGAVTYLGMTVLLTLLFVSYYAMPEKKD